MNIKKSVHVAIKRKLEDEQCGIRCDINRNRRDINALVSTQKCLKRELSELQKLINLLQ